jgi:hypothetical protein
MSGEPEWKFEGNTLVVESGAEKAAVTGTLEEVRFWIGGRNNDIGAGNATLRQRVEALWRVRRAALEKHGDTLRALTDRLKIPLRQSPDAPKPIAIVPTKAPTNRPLSWPPGCVRPREGLMDAGAGSWERWVVVKPTSTRYSTG